MPGRAGRSPSSTSTRRRREGRRSACARSSTCPVVGLAGRCHRRGIRRHPVERDRRGRPAAGRRARQHRRGGLPGAVPRGPSWPCGTGPRRQPHRHVPDVPAYLPQMIEHGYGRIVNMSSVSAQQGGGVFSKTPYSAAKAGIIGLTRSLAREMAAAPASPSTPSARASWTPTSVPAQRTRERGPAGRCRSDRPSGHGGGHRRARSSGCPARTAPTSPVPPRTSTAAPTSPEEAFHS